MKNAAAFRLTLHACLYFSVTTIFLPLKLQSYLCYYAITALILLSASCAVHLKSAFLRATVSLIPFAGLLLVPKAPAALVTGAIICAYASAFLIFGRFELEDWRLKRELKWIAFSCVPLLILSVGVYYGYMFAYSLIQKPTEEDERLYALYQSAIRAFLIFMLAAVTLGLLALRCVRSGRIKSARWQIGNIAGLIIPLAFAAVLGFFIGNIDLSGPIDSLAQAVASCSTKEQEATPSPTPIVIEKRPVFMPSQVPVEFEEWEYEEGMDTPHQKGNKVSSRRISIVVLAAIGAGLAVTLAAYLIIKGGRAKDKQLLADDSAKEHEEAEKGSLFRRRKRNKKGFGNSEKVREIYRRYISFLRMQGIRPSVSNTSEDISKLSHEVLINEQPDTILRALYIRARYASEDLSDEDVRLAEQTLDRLITAEKNNT